MEKQSLFNKLLVKKIYFFNSEPKIVPNIQGLGTFLLNDDLINLIILLYSSNLLDTKSVTNKINPDPHNCKILCPLTDDNKVFSPPPPLSTPPEKCLTYL